MRKVSVVIRTYNEQRHLRELLRGVGRQQVPGWEIETIIVDSGSTDATLQIASEFKVKMVPIRKEDFSFGRSLNIGCDAAAALVFISGHCIPVEDTWIKDLIAPLGHDSVAYTYGGQIGNGESHFSEKQIFGKYFPSKSNCPQDGFYCNNANAALQKKVWKEHPFDEELTGLEDMHLAKRLVAIGYKVGYVAQAAVYHLHDETWAQVRRRFEREAIALQYIMPEVHLSPSDVIRYFTSAVLLDVSLASQQRILSKHLFPILAYRFQQFVGGYKGNHFHRTLSHRRKDAFFYPR
jgi:rhamnosyltransferase